MGRFAHAAALFACLVSVAVGPAVLAQQARTIVKPRTEDTIRVSVYADNWFAMFVNGKLVAVDPIEFLPHNIVTFDLLPEYPMTIAVLAKDNADPATGMEYGDQVGDGGFILKMSDGTASSARWKAKAYFTAPTTTNGGTRREPIPDNWFAVDFDDRAWPAATAYAASQVRPPTTFRAADFAGAQFLWSSDLARDNTVIFRTTIERPGWQPAWTTKPDLDLKEAPFR